MSSVGTYKLDEFVGEYGFLDDRDSAEELFMHLTAERLTDMAVGSDWPIREDHCFWRVCYDNAYGDEWYDHVDGRPAIEHMEDRKLVKAISVALHMVTYGRREMLRFNERSLYWRGEKALPELEYSSQGDVL